MALFPGLTEDYIPYNCISLKTDDDITRAIESFNNKQPGT